MCVWVSDSLLFAEALRILADTALSLLLLQSHFISTDAFLTLCFDALLFTKEPCQVSTLSDRNVRAGGKDVCSEEWSSVDSWEDNPQVCSNQLVSTLFRGAEFRLEHAASFKRSSLSAMSSGNLPKR